MELDFNPNIEYLTVIYFFVTAVLRLNFRFQKCNSCYFGAFWPFQERKFEVRKRSKSIYKHLRSTPTRSGTGILGLKIH